MLSLEAKAKIIGILHHENLYEDDISDDIGTLLARILELEQTLKNQFGIIQEVKDCRIKSNNN